MNEFKDLWQQLDKKLNRQNELQFSRLKVAHLNRARSDLRPLFWGMALQVVFGLFCVLVAAPFWVGNLSTPVLWISGLVVHVYGLLAMVLGARIMLKINRLDMSAPVLGIQKQLVDLKKSYISSGWIVGLPWWVLWLPFSVIVLHQRTGLLSEQLPTTFLVIGSVCLVLMLVTVLAVRWASNSARPKLAAKIETLLAGVSLTKAQQSLDELLRFEHDEQVEQAE